jgi:predicted lipid-binding transport protein (Tim44 family)
MTPPIRFRPNRLLAVAATALILAASAAEARPGRGGAGGGFGSRGARTYEAPPATATAPRAAAPIERSATPQQPARPGVAQPGAQRPLAQQAGPFGRRGGFMGGLLGAGLVGMLLGYGLFGGLGGLMSILGLLLQVGLVVLLVGLVWRAFQRRSQPALAGAGAPLNRDARPSGGGLGGLAGGLAGAGRARPQRPANRDEVGIGQQDLNEFERLLGEVQTAYGREDVQALHAVATPEMAGHLEEELADNARRGVVNHVSDVRLLQGDLAESWREGGTEYATVAMRFSLVDHTVDRATGRTVEGDPERPAEATEVWTFTRPRGGRWSLSAIQPA